MFGRNNMQYFILIFIAAILMFAVYYRCEKTLNSLDQMLDCAISESFIEDSFTEKKLSKIESKLYRYLNKGTTSLRQISEEKNMIKTLISDISHQTKTPIANILLYSQLLNETQGLDKNAKQLAVQIEKQTEKLNFLISSLVKMSRLENGIVTLNPQINSIRTLIDSIDFKKIADEKNIDLLLEHDIDFSAYFDFKWTLEAISNIVDNALKYTPKGGKVTISSTEYEMFICIKVADNGIGITEEDSAKIFTRFYRSQNVSEEKGVGIGLYLTREIISKEGGYIKVKSSIGKGSIFSVFLPKKANLSKM